MKYRAEVDGLRAVAVVPVILFHAGLGLFSGGFVGVDVFFVISGYLITTIIVRELNEGRFSIVNFYERRARRILPALLLVVLTSIPFGWWLLSPRDLHEFAQSILAVATFCSNILFWFQSGYFDTEAELKPLLHTWSLAVEEQYYIFFPLLLMAAWAMGRRAILVMLAAIFLGSLALAHWASVHAVHPKIISGSFFLLPTRAWELLIGVFCAFYLERHEVRRSALSNVGSLLGIALIAFAVFAFDEHTPTSSLYTLIPTLGTALIILFAVRGTLGHTILANRLFVGIGLISYSAYLWHQPVLAYASYGALAELTLPVKLLLVVAVFPLSYLSWRYVEVPFRRARPKRRGGSVLIPYVAGFALLLPIGGALMVVDRGDSFSIDPVVARQERIDFARTFCATRDASGACVLEDKKILVVGDSMWLDALNMLWNRHQFRYDVSQLGGCPPHPDVASLNDTLPALRQCEQLNKARFSTDLSQYDGVAIIARYSWYTPRDLEPYLQYLRANGVQNIIVFGSYLGIDQRIDRLMRHFGAQQPLAAALDAGTFVRAEADNAPFADLQKDYGFHFVDVRALACKDGCTYFIGDTPYTFDIHHFTTTFASFLADRAAPTIDAFFSGETLNARAD